jgi:SPP1 gp7 family putative phage head morphogenesis protein
MTLLGAMIDLGMSRGYLKAVDNDHPYGRLLDRLEKQAAADIEAALRKMKRELFRDMTPDRLEEVFRRLTDYETNEEFRLSIYRALLPTIDAATTIERRALQKQVTGKSSMLDIGFNWELINEAARRWLNGYSFELVRGITNTTSTQLRGYIDEFIASPDGSIPQLTKRVDAIFGPVRGEMIAVTEVTRSFAHSQIETWNAAGVVERKRWNTANDALVCPICGPLNGQTANVNEPFPGGIDSPPAHPRCRCWVTAQIVTPEAMPLEASATPTPTPTPTGSQPYSHPRYRPVNVEFGTVEDGFWWAEDNLETKISSAGGTRVTKETLRNVLEVVQEFEFRHEGGAGARIIFDNKAFAGRPNVWASYNSGDNVLYMRGNASAKLSIFDGLPAHSFASTDFRSLMYHELTHATDGSSGWAYANQIKAVAQTDDIRKISRYALSDWWDVGTEGAEAIAEAVSAYVSGGEGKLTPAIRTIVEEIIRR